MVGFCFCPSNGRISQKQMTETTSQDVTRLSSNVCYVSHSQSWPFLFLLFSSAISHLPRHYVIAGRVYLHYLRVRIIADVNKSFVFHFHEIFCIARLILTLKYLGPYLIKVHLPLFGNRPKEMKKSDVKFYRHRSQLR